jgi:hypothetical protein
MLLIVLGLACLAGAAYLLGEAVTIPARQRQISVRRAATYGKLRLPGGIRERPFRERVVEPLAERLAALVLKLNPKTTLDSVSARLLSAGLGRTVSPSSFLAAKAAFALGGIVLGLVLGGAFAGARGALVFTLAFAGFGFIAPDLSVSARARRR